MRNKILTLAMIVFSTALGVAAQQTAPVKISNPQLLQDVNRKFNVQYPNSTASRRAPFTVDVRQEISADFRNTGTKTIRKISWEFITRNPDKPSKIEYIYTVNSKVWIMSGASARLSKTGVFWGRNIDIEARAVRIEFADGSVWQGTKTKK